jgi:group I intron endonuclease
MSAMIIHSIYRIVNTKNGKSYIGYSKNPKKRFLEHKNDSLRKNTHFYKAIKKYGWDCFRKEIIYQSLDKEHCKNVMENYFISEYDSYENGYNLTLGGEGSSYNRTEESKQKLSSARNHRFNAKDKDGNIHAITNDDPRFISGELVGVRKGVKLSQETIEKYKIRSKGNQARLGIPHTPEIRKLISERTSKALKGVPKKTIECPHCGKVGGAGNMKRYHFDFCKLLSKT